jgi:hypothetical protein
MPETSSLEEPSVISLNWYRGLPTGAAVGLLDRARAADAEMDFSAPHRQSTPASAHYVTAEVRTLLHRWNAPVSSEPQLAAVLTVITTPEQIATIDFTVDPDFRSTGVATAVFEELGNEESESRQWIGSGITAFLGCAYGSHPAALRLGMRFDAVVIGERHHLLLPSHRDYRQSRAVSNSARTAAVHIDERREEQVAATVWDQLRDKRTRPATRIVSNTATVDVDVHSGVGTIQKLTMTEPRSTPTGSALIAAVRAAVDFLWELGAESIETTVDTSDNELFGAFRSAAFQHDRTDLLFSRSSNCIESQPK